MFSGSVRAIIFPARFLSKLCVFVLFQLIFRMTWWSESDQISKLWWSFGLGECSWMVLVLILSMRVYLHWSQLNLLLEDGSVEWYLILKICDTGNWCIKILPLSFQVSGLSVYCICVCSFRLTEASINLWLPKLYLLQILIRWIFLHFLQEMEPVMVFTKMGVHIAPQKSKGRYYSDPILLFHLEVLQISLQL